MVPVCWCCQRCRSGSPEHRGFGSGCIDHPRDVHGMIVERVWPSLADLGVRRLVVWRGCGGHALRQAVARVSTRYADRARAFLPELSYHAIWCRIGDATNPGGHADALATSLALHLQPDTVRREVLAWPHPVAGGPEQPAA